MILIIKETIPENSWSRILTKFSGIVSFVNIMNFTMHFNLHVFYKKSRIGGTQPSSLKFFPFQFQRAKIFFIFVFLPKVSYILEDSPISFGLAGFLIKKRVPFCQLIVGVQTICYNPNLLAPHVKQGLSKVSYKKTCNQKNA